MSWFSAIPAEAAHHQDHRLLSSLPDNFGAAACLEPILYLILSLLGQEDLTHEHYFQRLKTSPYRSYTGTL